MFPLFFSVSLPLSFSLSPISFPLESLHDWFLLIIYIPDQISPQDVLSDHHTPISLFPLPITHSYTHYFLQSSYKYHKHVVCLTYILLDCKLHDCGAFLHYIHCYMCSTDCWLSAHIHFLFFLGT